MKVSSTTKLPTVKIASVSNIVTLATYGTNKEEYLYKPTFDMGSIMSIKRLNLNGYMSMNIDTAPNFYGIIEQINLLNAIGWRDIKVLFPVVIISEWI